MWHSASHPWVKLRRVIVGGCESANAEQSAVAWFESQETEKKMTGAALKKRKNAGNEICMTEQTWSSRRGCRKRNSGMKADNRRSNLLQSTAVYLPSKIHICTFVSWSRTFKNSPTSELDILYGKRMFNRVIYDATWGDSSRRSCAAPQLPVLSVRELRRMRWLE
jgi:hypothetical protein